MKSTMMLFIALTPTGLGKLHLVMCADVLGTFLRTRERLEIVCMGTEMCTEHAVKF